MYDTGMTSSGLTTPLKFVKTSRMAQPLCPATFSHSTVARYANSVAGY